MRPKAQLALIALLQLGLAIGLCWLPLFSDLGLERAVLTGVLCTLSAPFSARAFAALSPGRGPWALFSRALGFNLGLLCFGLLAGLWVEAQEILCDPAEGVGFFLLLCGGNLAFGCALGLLLAPLRARSFLLCLLAGWAGSFGWILWRLYSQPQIFVYSTVWGYWPGSIYDEAVTLDSRIFGLRAFTLALALGVVALAAAWRAGGRGRWALALLLLGLSALAWERGPSLGWRLDRADVKAALSTQLESAHFSLHLSPRIPARDAQSMLQEHERLYRVLSKIFSRPLPGKIHSYVYKDAAEKSRLMGGDNTQIARPWQREIHIQGAALPHPVLKHELAHIMAAAYASPPLYVPARLGLWPQMGLIEGLAVAADWPGQELSPHDWAQAMQTLRLLPPMAQLMSPTGFWSAASGRAYTASGSFLRYLIDRFGPARVLSAYDRGDLSASLGRPLAALVEDWERFLQARPADPRALARAKLRFMRPSVFSRVCPHEAAQLSREAYGRLRTGDFDRAAQSFARLARYEQGDAGPLLAQAQARLRCRGAGCGEGPRPADIEAAADLLQQAEALPSGARGLSLKAQLSRARGNWEGAREPLWALSVGPYPLAWRRWAALRLLSLDRPAAVRALLFPRVGEARDTGAIEQLATRAPEDGALAYLRGLELKRAGHPREATALLGRAVERLRAEAAGPLSDEENARRRARLRSLTQTSTASYEGLRRAFLRTQARAAPARPAALIAAEAERALAEAERLP